MSRKVVGIATAAISSGTNAMNEPKTKASTISAPAPATRTSSRTLTLVRRRRRPRSARRASRPVTSTGGAADRDAVERRLRPRGLRLAGFEPGRCGM